MLWGRAAAASPVFKARLVREIGAIDKAARRVKMNLLRVAFSLEASGSGCSGRGWCDWIRL
jgi:hypothetical protein